MRSERAACAHAQSSPDTLCMRLLSMFSILLAKTCASLDVGRFLKNAVTTRHYMGLGSTTARSAANVSHFNREQRPWRGTCQSQCRPPPGSCSGMLRFSSDLGAYLNKIGTQKSAFKAQKGGFHAQSSRASTARIYIRAQRGNRTQTYSKCSRSLPVTCIITNIGTLMMHTFSTSVFADCCFFAHSSMPARAFCKPAQGHIVVKKSNSIVSFIYCRLGATHLSVTARVGPS